MLTKELLVSIGCSLCLFTACSCAWASDVEDISFLERPDPFGSIDLHEISFFERSSLDAPPISLYEEPEQRDEEKKPEMVESHPIASFHPSLLLRADALPIESFEDATDPYLEGYIQ